MSITTLTPSRRGRIRIADLAPLASAGRPEGDSASAVLAVYARQVDELARMVEDWQAACAGYASVLAGALGELHVVLEETAARLDGRTELP